MSQLKDNTKQIFMGVVLLLIYLPALMWIWDRWFVADSYYSHGILIPLVSAYLIWQRREELRKLPAASSGLGQGLIILGIGMYLVSSVFRIYFSAGFSMIVVISGLVLHFYGTQVFRKCLFPICFLCFMVPVPLVVIVNLSFKLKLFAAMIATKILNNMGLAATQQGSIIKMQHTYVIVDDVCSGLRSLISLMALGSIFAFWLKAPFYKRIILFLTTIPIAIVTNVFRVIFLSTVSEIWGSKYATGWMHDLTGFMVFAIAFVLLFCVGKLLE